MSRWGVVATVDEPAVVVAAMAFHHLAQGAAEIHLYLDSPIEGLARLLDGRPEIRITLCDDGYWAASPRGARPPDSMERQCANADDAYARAQVDWLLHCDADEFLSDGAALAREISAMPASLDVLRLPTLERVLRRERPQADLFEGVFRRPAEHRRWLRRLVLGAAEARLTVAGLCGHNAGKSLTRVGQGHRILCHVPMGGPRLDEDLPHRWAREARILHFDALTPFAWQVKLLRVHHGRQPRTGRQQRSPQRQAMIDAAVGAAGDRAAWEAVVRPLVTLSRLQRLALTLAGIVERPRVDAGEALRAAVPDADLSAAGFDRALQERHAALMAACGIG